MSKKNLTIFFLMLLLLTFLPTVIITDANEFKDISNVGNEKKAVLPYHINMMKGACANTIDTTQTVTSVSNLGSGDVLDQYQNETNDWGWYILPYQWIAQCFTPTLSVLTRVELRFFRSGTPPSLTLTASIRDDLYGEDLAVVYKNNSDLPDSSGWVEFDFSDLLVIPEQPYYIVCKTDGGGSGAGYLWFIDFYNPYTRGDAWGSPDGGYTWWIMDYPPEYPETDCCFKTYGLDEASMKTTFMFGRITGRSVIGNFTMFEAVNLRCIQFAPFQFLKYRSGEKIAISDKKLGIVTDQFVFGFFQAHL